MFRLPSETSLLNELPAVEMCLCCERVHAYRVCLLGLYWKNTWYLESEVIYCPLVKFFFFFHDGNCRDTICLIANAVTQNCEYVFYAE